MIEIWDTHGPPPFVTLAAAHLDPKKKKRRNKNPAAVPDAKTPSNAKGKKATVKDSPVPEGTGTMADLAAFFGMKGGKKKVTF